MKAIVKRRLRFFGFEIEEARAIALLTIHKFYLRAVIQLKIV